MSSTLESRHHENRTLLLAGILHAFTHVYQVALLPLYFLIQSDLKLANVDQATFLVTALMLSYFLPSYFMGVLADRLSKKSLLTYGLIINGLGFVILGLARSYGQAVAGVVVAGFGGSFFHPAATALIARLFPTSTGKALGIFGIGASVGFFVGPLYAGWRAAASSTWRAPVIELGVAGIIFALGFSWLADEEPPGQKKSSVTISLFPTKGLLALFLLSAFFFSLRDFTGSSMGSLGSLFLQQAHGLDTKRTGRILSAIFLASAISNPLFGKLSDKGRFKWSLGVLIIAAGLVAYFPHVQPAYGAILLAAYGFFFMSSYPIIEAAVMNSVHHSVRGRVFGLFITVGGAVGNLAHWLSGYWVKQLGPRAHEVNAYYPIYLTLAGLIIVSLLGLPCLRVIHNREEALHLLEPTLTK